MLSFKPAFSLSSFTFIKRLFSSSSLSAIRVLSSAYLRLLIFLPAILIPVCDSSSPTILLSVAAFSCPQSFTDRDFASESSDRIRWSKYWSFSISPSNEYPGLISSGIHWFDLLVVQGTLKGLLEHHSLKASVLQRSAFFMVQISHMYMTIGKTVALTLQSLVGKVMSLLFNTAFP